MTQPTTTTTATTTTIFNYDYIAHDAKGNQRNSEAIHELEAFYLLFNPPSTTPATPPIPPNDTHLPPTNDPEGFKAADSHEHTPAQTQQEQPHLSSRMRCTKNQKNPHNPKELPQP